VLRDVTEYVVDRLRARGELIPHGFTWTFVVTVDVSLLVILTAAALQRLHTGLLPSLVAALIAFSPPLLFFFSGIKFHPALIWFTTSAATAILLFSTSAPIESDIAPMLLVVMIGIVASHSAVLQGALAAASACALLVFAAASHHVDALPLYLTAVGLGWLVGFLMRIQQQLLVKQEENQAALAELAAADERRRIAREVHDVIAHSLSVTLLHLTGARRALQEDRDVDDAVDALEQAERLGRQAMADIRRTVGLLDGAPVRTAPEPGIDDIPRLVDDFVRAGLSVRLHVTGSPERVSPAVGLALFRIAQESLANIAKHAPESTSSVLLSFSQSSAHISVDNRLPVAVQSSEGRGVRGMRQRVELLGGILDVGPSGDEWSVRAEIPLAEGGRSWCGR
jgi:signal transduction histidine kinase